MAEALIDELLSRVTTAQPGGTMTAFHRRVAAMVLPVVAALVLTACGSDDPDKPTKPTASATQSPEDKVQAVQEAYWAAYVQMANSGEVSSRGFDGIAEGTFVEGDLRILGVQADDGFVRVGAPSFSDYSVKVDGAEATSLVCVDFSPWGSKNSKGEDVEIPPTKPSPFLATLEERDGTWVMIDQEYQKDTPCP